MYFLSMVRLSVCPARHGRGEHLRQDVVKTYRLVRRSSHDQFVKAFSSLHHDVSPATDVFLAIRIL